MAISKLQRFWIYGRIVCVLNVKKTVKGIEHFFFTIWLILFECSTKSNWVECCNRNWQAYSWLISFSLGEMLTVFLYIHRNDIHNTVTYWSCEMRSKANVIVIKPPIWTVFQILIWVGIQSALSNNRKPIRWNNCI